MLDDRIVNGITRKNNKITLNVLKYLKHNIYKSDNKAVYKELFSFIFPVKLFLLEFLGFCFIFFFKPFFKFIVKVNKYIEAQITCVTYNIPSIREK